MPFIPAVVNVLLYFAGYTPSQRDDIFGALSVETQHKLIESDVDLATYALPVNHWVLVLQNNENPILHECLQPKVWTKDTTKKVIDDRIIDN